MDRSKHISKDYVKSWNLLGTKVAYWGERECIWFEKKWKDEIDSDGVYITNKGVIKIFVMYLTNEYANSINLEIKDKFKARNKLEEVINRHIQTDKNKAVCFLKAERIDWDFLRESVKEILADSAC